MQQARHLRYSADLAQSRDDPATLLGVYRGVTVVPPHPCHTLHRRPDGTLLHMQDIMRTHCGSDVSTVDNDNSNRISSDECALSMALFLSSPPRDKAHKHVNCATAAKCSHTIHLCATGLQGPWEAIGHTAHAHTAVTCPTKQTRTNYTRACAPK